MAVTAKNVKAKVVKDIVDLLDILDPSGESGKIYTEKFHLFSPLYHSMIH